MTSLKKNASTLDSTASQLYRLGGIAAFAIGVAYIAIIALYASVGAPPVGGEAWLNYLAGKSTAWWSTCSRPAGSGRF
jgi:hypothetical protein